MTERSAGDRPLFMVLGNQLFPYRTVRAYQHARFFMAEDLGLCTYVRHHKQKLVLFLAAMRSYADGLRRRGVDLHYEPIDGPTSSLSYEQKLRRAIKRHGCTRIVCFEIEDCFFEKRIEQLAQDLAIPLEVLPSPMFLTSRTAFEEYLNEVSQPLMAGFYQRQRRRLGLLVDEDGRPHGGRWSFDAENRKKLPVDVPVPQQYVPSRTSHVREVADLVDHQFPDHPGDTSNFWLPTTRRQALRLLDAFLQDKFHQFGDYEDALSTRDPFLFHSTLSPVLNVGLITPDEVIARVMQVTGTSDVPLNALEGLIRQIVGWREFVRGIYHAYDDRQQAANFWNHHRKLTDAWYDGTTGLRPLDDAIRKAQRYGWTHHIERLMVLGNLMLLSEIEPAQAHRWFMEMFVDSSDWVMGPNVYGMALFSDGGIFATKPYICGSNYLLKMSDYVKGDWCDVIDGLYWRFVGNNRDFFAGNPRLSMMTRTLDKIDPQRLSSITTAAEGWLERVTEPRAESVQQQLPHRGAR